MAMNSVADTGRARNEARMARRRSSAPIYTAEVVDDMAALDRIEAFYRHYRAHPASHFDLLRAAFASGESAPFFVQVACDGRPCLLMAGQRVRGRLRWRLGYGITLASRACTIEVRRGGWLGDLTRPGLEFLCEYLDGALRRGGADAITFATCRSVRPCTRCSGHARPGCGGTGVRHEA